MLRAIRSPVALVLVCGSALAACGGDSGDKPAATTPSVATATTITPTPTTTVTTPRTETNPPPPTPETTTPTETVPQQTGASCGEVAGGFIRRIQTKGVTCPTARRVAHDWLARVQSGSDPARPIILLGFTCAARFRGELATVLCEEGGDPERGRVVFSAHP